MNFDMKGLSAEHQGKRLRIEFSDGEVCEAELLSLSTCQEHADCCGITFDLLRTNRPEKHQRVLQNTPQPAIWFEMHL